MERKLEIPCLSASYQVRPLGPEDVETVYQLSRGNLVFYQYHPPFVTRESIREDMAALPPGKTRTDKFYVGFFDGAALVAVMDLILDYPGEGTAWIGLFMVDVRYQGQGTGSQIIRECLSVLQAGGFSRVRLGVDQGNPQSSHFWQKNVFRPVEERGAYIVYER